MMTPPKRTRGRKIVVSLQTVTDIEPPMRIATTLAAAIEAEVVGLFVEEDSLMDVAGLPFTSAIDTGTGQLRPLSRDTMLNTLARRSAEIERRLLAIARRTSVACSFARQQGDLQRTIDSVLEAGDFLMLAGDKATLVCLDHVKDIRAVPQKSGGVVVVAQRSPGRSKGPVIAIDDGDASGAATLAMAARLAAVSGVPLILFAIAADDSGVQSIVSRARDIAAGLPSFSHRQFEPGSAEPIAAALVHEEPSFIVADLEGEPFSDEAAARRLLRAANAPVVLVRDIRPAEAVETSEQLTQT